MNSIKINGNKDQECSFSQEVSTEEVSKPEQEAEFKVNADLLNNSEIPKIRVINNLT